MFWLVSQSPIKPINNSLLCVTDPEVVTFGETLLLVAVPI